jgi:hypothetical protein
LKALTLYRPWVWSIIHGPKRIENRPWKPWPKIIGQRILLHAGATWDAEGAEYIERVLGHSLPPEAAVRGLIGSVLVVGCITEHGAPPPGQGVWFFGPFGWVLEDVQALPEPVPCKGALGLWDCPAKVLEQVKA